MFSPLVRPRHVAFLLLLSAAVAAAQTPAGTPSDVPGVQPPGAPPLVPDAPPLTLADAIALALERNELPRIALARIEQARAQRQLAYTQLFPVIAATGAYLRRARETVANVNGQPVVVRSRDAFNGQLVLSAPLFDASSFNTIAQSAWLLDAQRLDAEETRRLLAFDVAESFLAVLSSEQVEAAARQRVALAQQITDEARARLEAGLGDVQTAVRGELELAAARTVLTQASGSVYTTRLALGFLLDTPVTQPLAMRPTRVPQAAPDALIDEADTHRPDLRAQIKRVRAADLAAVEPWLRLLPTLDLQGSGIITNEGAFAGGSTDWNLGVTLTWVLFDAGVRYAQAAARSAELLEAQLGTDLLRRQIALDVRTALVQVDVASEGLTASVAQEAAARRNVELVADRVKAGLSTAIEQADASTSAYQAATDVVRQRFALHLAQLRLLEALGRWPLEREPTAK